MASLLGLSLYGNYHYYFLLPFNQPYFIMTCLSTFLLGIM